MQSTKLNPQPSSAGLQNGGAEASAEWVFMHMEDPDFNDPLPVPGASASAPSGDVSSGGGGGGGGGPVDAEAVGVLAGMGFTEPQAEAALKVLAVLTHARAYHSAKRLQPVDGTLSASGCPFEPLSAGKVFCRSA